MEPSHLRSGIMKLPTEIFLEIVKQLPLKDKKSARLVCKKWAEVTDYELNFKVILTDENFKYFKKFGNRVQSVKMGRFLKPLALTNEDCMILSEAQILELSNDMHRLRLETPGNTSENIKVILQTCKNISELRINGEFVDSVVLTAPLDLHNVKLPNLTSIIINLDEVRDDILLKAFAKLQIPNLTSVKFHRASLCYCCGHLFDSDTFSAVYNFIKAHQKKLKILVMHNTIAAVVRVTLQNPLRRLRTRGVSSSRFHSVTVFVSEFVHVLPLPDLQLESLEISHPAETFGSNWELASAIIDSQKSLKSLKLVVKYFHFYRELMQLIRQNPALEVLEIDQRVPIFGFHVPLLLDIDNFQYCKNLQELRISSSYTPQNITSIPTSVKILHWSGRLRYDQVRFIACNLKSLKHVALNHVFIDRPSERYPFQGQRVNIAYFDSDLLMDFQRMPNLIALRVCDCDIRHFLLPVLNYCTSENINVRRGYPNEITPLDFLPCSKINTLCTFNFSKKV